MQIKGTAHGDRNKSAIDLVEIYFLIQKCLQSRLNLNNTITLKKSRSCSVCWQKKRYAKVSIKT